MGVRPYHHPKMPQCPNQLFKAPQTLRLGLSDYGAVEDEFIRASELGIHFMRLDFPWRNVVPKLSKSDLWERHELEENPHLVEQLIKKLEQSNAWVAFDRKIAWAKKFNIEMIPIVGHGYQFDQPFYKGKPFGPHLVGKEKYLGTMALFVRAFVRRYAEHFNYVQIENELNVAAPTMLWGWRLPSGMEGMKSGPFADWNFLTEIIKTLSHSVRREHATARIIHNFHTDLSVKMLHRLGLPSWSEAVEWWRPYLDIIGLDLYPTYYDANKNYRGNLARQVEKAKLVGCGRPVMIMETNYPRGPHDRAFDALKQAAYVKNAIDEARASGAEALLFYGAVSLSYQEDHEHFSASEKRLIKKLGQSLEQGDLLGLGFTLFWHNRLVKSGELAKLLTTVEPFWDFFDENRMPVPAYAILRDATDYDR